MLLNDFIALQSRSGEEEAADPAARRPFGCPCPWHLRRPLPLAVRRTAARQAPRICSWTKSWNHSITSKTGS